MQNELPVVVIGAGPQGLAAAAHLVEREQPVLVLEAGEGAAAAVREWGHVRLFSEWSELIDPAAARIALQHGCQHMSLVWGVTGLGELGSFSGGVPESVCGGLPG